MPVQTSNQTSALVERATEEALAGRPVTRPEEIAALFELPLFGPDAARVQAAGRRLSDMACGGRAEVHAQVALNVGPCPRNCLFCAFAEAHEVFTESKDIPLEYVIAQARQFEIDGANAIYLMATGAYPFERYLARADEVRKRLRPETLLIANVGDFGVHIARELRAAGFEGIYHAVRLGEGQVTRIPVSRRLQTIRAAQAAGLQVGTCLEPVGPEHSTAELLEKLLIARDISPAYAGAARRITIPDTALAGHGMVSEARMAHIIAVSRLVLPLAVRGNCTHEPNSYGAAAGANLFWAEAGANPRDTRERTEEGRGATVARCREIFREAEWASLDGPSGFFASPDASGARPHAAVPRAVDAAAAAPPS
jgi:biotin synthase